MAIQYPKIEHVTLPSVDGFNGSLNILRDPPKSIFTKRIDKVGQNNDINREIDDSGDRVNEGISVYARGVNPMVSVSYDNNSNNAGVSVYSQGQGHYSGSGQAYLPYRVMDKGAFRPPIRSQRDLLPLSRQPRAWFQALSNPGYTDFTKQKYNPTRFRMIRDMLLKTENQVTPNKSVKIEKPILANMKMKQMINDKHINIEASSGKRSLDHSNYTRENFDRYKGIQENYEQVDAITNKNSQVSHNLSNLSINEKHYVNDKDYYESNTNLSRSINQVLDGKMNTEQYVHDHTYYDVTANKGENIQTKTIDELYSNNRTSTKDVSQYSLDAGKQTGYTVMTEIPDIELERHMPAYSTATAKNDPTMYKRVQHQNTIDLKNNLPTVNTLRNITRLEDTNTFDYASSRQVKLPETLRKGEFNNAGIQPTLDRSEIPVRVDSHKETIRKYMNDSQFSRFNY